MADGVELAVDTWEGATSGATDGSGSRQAAPPFLLVHGLASNARMWDGVAAALSAAGHPVVAVDLRGHGRSSKPDGLYHVSVVADDLAALIRRSGLDRPIAAGQSWGANVVLDLAARHPAAVRGIACIDGGWLEPSREFADWDACLAALAPPRLLGLPSTAVEARVRGMHPDWPETGIRGVLANFEIRPDGTVAPWLTFERHVDVLRGLWEHHPSALYASLAVPALLVPADGGQSERARRTRAAVEAAAAAIPRARVRWLEGEHDLHAQHPDQLAAILHEAASDGFFR